MREEEEALAQAEIWDAIADQTKVENREEERGASGNAGAAKMAADWAIDQSLAALKKAEEDNDNDSETTAATTTAAPTPSPVSYTHLRAHET